MSRVPLLAVLIALAGVALACPWQDRAGAENLSAKHATVERPLDANLRFLLRETAHEADSPFFVTLSALARQHGWDLSASHTEEGRAIAVREGRTRYVVVILGGWTHTIPGTEWRQLLLLDHDGRLLDLLSCNINSRLTQMLAGPVFLADTPEVPEEDGAQFVIRFFPRKGRTISGNFSHSILHAGKEQFFGWNQDKPGAVPSAEWARQGLCRVAVRHGKFTVLFPSSKQTTPGS
jgi:hypothetical protein